MSLDKTTKRLLREASTTEKTQSSIQAGITQSKNRLEKVCQHFFPAIHHQGIREFFSKLHDLYFGNAPNDLLVSAITKPSKGQLSAQNIGDLLKQDSQKWLRLEHSIHHYRQKELFEIGKNLKVNGII
jgi:hypothetical protein